jgi:hypothetical protein
MDVRGSAGTPGATRPVLRSGRAESRRVREVPPRGPIPTALDKRPLFRNAGTGRQGRDGGLGRGLCRSGTLGPASQGHDDSLGVRQRRHLGVRRASVAPLGLLERKPGWRDESLGRALRDPYGRRNLRPGDLPGEPPGARVSELRGGEPGAGAGHRSSPAPPPIHRSGPNQGSGDRKGDRHPQPRGPHQLAAPLWPLSRGRRTICTLTMRSIR